MTYSWDVEDAPVWRQRLHIRSYRLTRLIELNAPAKLIKNEVLMMMEQVVLEAPGIVENTPLQSSDSASQHD